MTHNLSPGAPPLINPAVISYFGRLADPFYTIGSSYRTTEGNSVDEWDFYIPRIDQVRLISDGSSFYEVPLPFSLEFEKNQGPTAVELELSVLPTTLAAPTRSATARAAIPPDFLPLSSTTRVVAPQIALSDEEARAEIETYIRASIWFVFHMMEPRVGGEGVPECALQLAKPGGSIWECFVKRTRRKGSIIFKCVACGYESDRLHRAVSHQRVKWGHKPFPCTDPGWLVSVYLYFRQLASLTIPTLVCRFLARSVVPPRRVCPTTAVQGLLPLHVNSGKSL